jgi:hypothetical protein
MYVPRWVVRSGEVGGGHASLRVVKDGLYIQPLCNLSVTADEQGAISLAMSVR